MEDPYAKDKYVSGAEVLDSAAEYVSLRGSDRDVRLNRDISKYAMAKQNLQTLLATAEKEWCDNWAERFVPYSRDELEAARCIPVHKSFARLPSTCLAVSPDGWKSLLLAAQNMVRFFRCVPATWKKQPMYHILKPGTAVAQYPSYRTLALNECELR
jgi:hypothetical protein